MRVKKGKWQFEEGLVDNGAKHESKLFSKEQSKDPLMKISATNWESDIVLQNSRAPMQTFGTLWCFAFAAQLPG